MHDDTECNARPCIAESEYTSVYRIHLRWWELYFRCGWGNPYRLHAMILRRYECRIRYPPTQFPAQPSTSTSYMPLRGNSTIFAKFHKLEALRRALRILQTQSKERKHLKEAPIKSGVESQKLGPDMNGEKHVEQVTDLGGVNLLAPEGLNLGRVNYLQDYS